MKRENQTFNILSLLLSYPDQELIENLDVLKNELIKERILGNKALKQLSDLFDWMGKNELLDIEEHYITHFERTSSLSLYLFEHIHGDSKERGQAMVDLSQHYRQYGFFSIPSELPDYLPLFLEFLSFIPMKEARSLLGETINILQALLERLTKRQSPYTAVLFALINLTSAVPNFSLVNQYIINDNGNPLPNEVLDKLWEEKAVTFMSDETAKSCSSCPTSCGVNVKGGRP